MKKYIYILCLCLVSLYQIGCTSTTDQKYKSPKVIYTDSLHKVTTLKYGDKNYFKECFLVKLETSEKCLINEVTQIEIMNDLIYIFNQQLSQVLTFDFNGKYLGNVGVKGQGPGEYLAISSFFIDPKNKTINLIDPLNMAVIQYKVSGEFVGKYKHENNNLSFIKKAVVINDNQLFCYFSSNWEDNSLYSIVDRTDFHTIRNVRYYPEKTTQYISYSVSNQPFSFYDENITYSMIFSDTISRYRDGIIEPYLKIDNGKKQISQKSLKRVLEEQECNYIQVARNIAKEEEYITGFTNIVENKRFIIVDFGTKETVMSAVLWDKIEQKGIYIDEYWQTIGPDFGLIKYSNENTIVKIWSISDILSFKLETSKNNSLLEQYPQEIKTILNDVDEEDNPVLVVYKLRD